MTYLEPSTPTKKKVKELGYNLDEMNEFYIRSRGERNRAGARPIQFFPHDKKAAMQENPSAIYSKSVQFSGKRKAQKMLRMLLLEVDSGGALAAL